MKYAWINFVLAAAIAFGVLAMSRSAGADIAAVVVLCPMWLIGGAVASATVSRAAFGVFLLLSRRFNAMEKQRSKGVTIRKNTLK